MQAIAEKSMFVESDVATWSDADYRRLLAELDPIFQAIPGDPAFERSTRLVDLIEAYEDVHYPMGQPSQEAVAEYERDKRGIGELVAA